MPYFAIENTDWSDGFVGLAFTMGYLPQEKCFSIVITLVKWSIAFGLDFDF